MAAQGTGVIGPRLSLHEPDSQITADIRSHRNQ
jgi:hypothetical protein